MPDLGQFLTFKTENRDAVASLYLSSGDLRCDFPFWGIIWSPIGTNSFITRDHPSIPSSNCAWYRSVFDLQNGNSRRSVLPVETCVAIFRFEASFDPQLIPTWSSLGIIIICPDLAHTVPNLGQFLTSKTDNRNAMSYFYLESGDLRRDFPFWDIVLPSFITTTLMRLMNKEVSKRNNLFFSCRFSWKSVK